MASVQFVNKTIAGLDIGSVETNQNVSKLAEHGLSYIVHLSHESQTINVLFQISKLDRSRELQIWSGELQIRVLKF